MVSCEVIEASSRESVGRKGVDDAATSRRTCVWMSILATAPDGFAVLVVRLLHIVKVSEVAGFVGLYEFACRPHGTVVVDREALQMSAWRS